MSLDEMVSTCLGTTSYLFPSTVHNHTDVVHMPLDRWNQWAGVRDHFSKHHESGKAQCVYEAVGCSSDTDSEACFMRRAMELLLPGGGVLRSSFRESALMDESAWRGAGSAEFRRVLGAYLGNDEASRFAGALHVR